MLILQLLQGNNYLYEINASAEQLYVALCSVYLSQRGPESTKFMLRAKLRESKLPHQARDAASTYFWCYATFCNCFVAFPVSAPYRWLPRNADLNIQHD